MCSLNVEKWNQDKVLRVVERQLAEWIPEKYGWKRTPHRTYMRIYKIICHLLFGRKKWGSRKCDFDLGIDEFGRSVSEGMRKYVDILIGRGIRLNAVIVLGSRAKGRWTPTSDIDVTIIADNIPRVKAYPRLIKRIVGLKRWFLLSDIPLFMDVEPSRCYSKEEFISRMLKFDIHTLDALYFGKVIYDNGFWEQIRGTFVEIEKKYCLEETNLKIKLQVL